MKYKIDSESKEKSIPCSEYIRDQIKSEKNKAICELLLHKGSLI